MIEPSATRSVRSALDSKTIDKIAYLGALSLFLSTIEYLLPRPVPFMRLGLANLPLILALETFTVPAYAMLVVVKVLGQALVNGTLASYIFLFSLAGTVASATVMIACHRGLKEHISFLGISVVGALASNVVQIVLSVAFIFGPSAWRILPLFLGIGLATGFLMGVFAQRFSTHSRWWARFAKKQAPRWSSADADGNSDTDDRRPNRRHRGRRSRRKRVDRLARFLNPRFRFWTGLCLIPGYLLLDGIQSRLAALVLFGILAVLAGKRIRVGYYSVLTASIVFFHLLRPLGRTIASIGPLIITSGAFQTGLMKALTLCGLILISQFSVSRSLQLPGRIGSILSRTFLYFEKILDGKRTIRPRNFIATLDRTLLEMSRSEIEDQDDAPLTGVRTAPRSILIGTSYFLLLNVVVWGDIFQHVL